MQFIGIQAPQAPAALPGRKICVLFNWKQEEYEAKKMYKRSGVLEMGRRAQRSVEGLAEIGPFPKKSLVGGIEL